MIKNDIDKQYDIYYTGSSNSLYNQRFGKNRVIYREYTIITSLLKRVFNQKFKSEYSSIFSFFRSKLQTSKQSSKTQENTNGDNIFRILDFGCGDGRIFPVIEKFASKHTKTKFEIIAYDPSIVGLREFINILKQNGFISIDYNNNDNIIDKKHKDHPKDMSIIDTLVRDNIEVKFLNNKVDAALENITYFTNGQIDAILSIYCPLFHISGRLKRVDTIASLKKIMHKNGELIINVSNISSRQGEYIFYNELRRQYKVAKNQNNIKLQSCLRHIIGEAREEGDIYYVEYNQNSSVINFGHLYTLDELCLDASSAGLDIIKQGAMSVDRPYRLSQNFLNQLVDNFFAYIYDIKLMLFSDQNIYLPKNIYVIT